MLNLILFQPEIPPNTGNIIRLCANNGFNLQLILPLGFDLDEKRVRRAGLDYHELATVAQWPSWQAYIAQYPQQMIYAFTTKANRNYSQAVFKAGDALLFGPETRGLPASMLEAFPNEQKLRIPMKHNNRSLNLSNSVAIAAYEAWRQLDFG